MRFKEFKPSLYEFVVPNQQSGVDILAQILKNTDRSSQEYQTALQILKKLKLKMDQFTHQPEPVPGQLSENIMNDDELVNWYLSSLTDAETKSQMEKMLVAQRPLLVSLAKHQQSRDVEQEKQVRGNVEQERKNAEKFVSELVSKIINSKFTAGKDVSIKAVIGVLEGMIRTEEVSFQEVKDFLMACDAGGIIDTAAMIPPQGGAGSIPLNDEKYKSFIQNFLNIAEVKVGNATWGRGEIGLAFCGIDAKKESSDISVGDTAIEVKAGSDRIDVFLKGTKGFKSQAPALEELVNALNSVAKKNDMPQFKPTNKSKLGGISKLGFRKVVGTKTEMGLNEYFKHMGKDAVEDLLVRMLLQIHKANPSIVKKYEQDIRDTVNPSGAVYYKQLATVTSTISFEYYQAMENHDGVLFLNISNFSYNYIPASAPERFGQLVSDQTIVPTSVMDFRDNSDGGISYFIR